MPTAPDTGTRASRWSAGMVIDFGMVTAPNPPGSSTLISPCGAVFEIAPANVLHGAVRLHGLASSPTPDTQVRVACALAGAATSSMATRPQQSVAKDRSSFFMWVSLVQSCRYETSRNGRQHCAHACSGKCARRTPIVVGQDRRRRRHGDVRILKVGLFALAYSTVVARSEGPCNKINHTTDSNSPQ